MKIRLRLFQLQFFRASILVLMVNPAWAYQGAVSGATAQSGRAAIETTDTPFFNPAGVAHIRGYYFTTTYSSGALVPEVRQREYSLALMDNMDDTVLPTTLAFNERVQQIEDRTLLRKDFLLSMGYLINANWSVGLAAKYQDDYNIDRYRQTNGNIGVLWTPKKNLAVAAVMENVGGIRRDLPLEIQQRPITSFGVAYLHSKVIRMKADLTSSSENKLDKPTLSIGVESFLTQWVLTRVGVQKNQETEASLYTGGLGFLGPRFSANYAYLQESQNNQSRHAVDLTIPLW